MRKLIDEPKEVLPDGTKAALPKARNPYPKEHKTSRSLKRPKENRLFSEGILRHLIAEPIDGQGTVRKATKVL